PGNVRALKNCLERAWILSRADGKAMIEPEYILFDDTRSISKYGSAVPVDLLPRDPDDLSPESLQVFTDWAEGVYYTRAFEAAQRHKSRLAEKLGLSRD